MMRWPIVDHVGLPLNIGSGSAGQGVIDRTREVDEGSASVVWIEVWITWRHRNIEGGIRRLS
jgi:hypothetical protein